MLQFRGESVKTCFSYLVALNLGLQQDRNSNTTNCLIVKKNVTVQNTTSHEQLFFRKKKNTCVLDREIP